VHIILKDIFFETQHGRCEAQASALMVRLGCAMMENSSV
jgi:hypothetical protein